MSFSLGGAAAGGLQGAGYGSQIGGPWGAGIGGLLGALGGGFFGGGKEGGFDKLETLSPEQKQLLMQQIGMLGQGGALGEGYGQGLNYWRELLDPSSQAYQRFEEPYMRQFQQETVPQLAERFAGAGAQGGALSSSGFGQALSTAGANLQSQLAALRTGLMQQATQGLANQYQQTLGKALGTPAFAYQKRQAEPGLAGYWAQAGFPGAKQGMSGLADFSKMFLPG